MEFGSLLNRYISDREFGWSYRPALHQNPLNTSAEFWYGMQAHYDLWQAKKKFRGKVRSVVHRDTAAA